MSKRTKAQPESTFDSLQKDWRAVHKRSDAEALFSSWEWQSSWFQAFADATEQVSLKPKGEASLQPLWILPCFICIASVKGPWRISRLQLGGGVFRGSIVKSNAIRSEHLGVIMDSSADSSEAINEIVREACELEWQEFVLPDLDIDLEINQQLVSAFAQEGFFVRIADRHASYSITLPSSFDSYLAGLSGSSRRRLFNKRALLRESYDVELIDLSRDDWNAAIKLLSELHERRWHKPIYSQEQLEFHTVLREKLGPEKVEISCMFLNGRPVSALHNVTVDGVVYNLQSGFDAAVDSRFSPMFLHLGFLIEAAIDNGFQRFHLLAGAGKNTDYKAKLSNDQHTLLDVQIIRDGLLAAAYKVLDRLLG